MSDADGLALLAGLTLLTAAGFAALLRRWRPGWSARRRNLLAALPVPGVPGLPCLAFFLYSWWMLLFHKEHCGVDACAMGIMFSAIVLFWLCIVYLIGVAVAALTLRLLLLSSSREQRDI